MIIRSLGVSARMLGVGVLALALTATTAMAQSKKTQCPFNSKDVDGWYKEIGFDTGADDAGRSARVSCASESGFATLDEIELRMGPKSLAGETVQANSTFKHIMIDVQATGSGGFPQYSIQLVADGSPIPDAKAGDNIPLNDAEYEACVSELTGSQTWNRWSCGKQ